MSHHDLSSIRLLKNLFDQCHESGNNDLSDSENYTDFTETASSFGPGDVKLNKSEVKNTLDNPLLKTIDHLPAVKSMNEWESEQTKDQELLDTRRQPEYSIVYKQSITSEDVYLQLGLKTPATSSCEDMVVDIHLTDETVGISQMDLEVEAELIRLQTPVYRLCLPLPQKVEPKQSRATYNCDKNLLKLTLRLQRELDFVNF